MKAYKDNKRKRCRNLNLYIRLLLQVIIQQVDVQQAII